MSRIEDAKIIIETLVDNGYDAFIVGGYVRDKLLDIETNDIDIATSATPDVVENLFSKTILTGVNHGTVTVVINNANYEVTTFRTENDYLNNRKPTAVNFVSSLFEDVKRRDFTMNALALNLSGEIIDYVSGKEDIKNKLIRTVGNPFERFSEDALRMLRAFRFVSLLGFDIESEALKAINKNSDLIKNISLERIIKEFEALVRGKDFLKAIKLMKKTNFHISMPYFNKGIDVIADKEFVPLDFYEFLTICAVVDEDDLIENLPILKLLKKEIRIVYEMYTLNITNFTNPILFRNGLRNCLMTNKLNVYLRNNDDKSKEIIEMYQTMPIKKQCDLKFKGDEIISLYEKTPGSWISEILDDICLNVLLGHLENDYEKIRQYLLSKK